VPVLILEEKKHIQTNKRMNYAKYESKIIEELGVALIGWPEDGKVENPGILDIDKSLALRKALETNECRRIILTSEQKKAWIFQNAQCEQDGEPPRKKQATGERSVPENEGVDEDVEEEDLHDVNMACQ